MIKATQKDKELVCSILIDSFEDNKSVNYVIKQDSKRLSRIGKLMEYSFDMCLNYGLIYLSESKKGCVLVLYPHTKKSALKTTFLDVKLALSVGLSKVSLILDREKKIKMLHPPEPFMHLWFIGVEKKEHGKGIGTHLLKDIITVSEEQKLPIYLETSVDTNVTWYEKFGFKVFSELTFNYKLMMLKREIAIL